MYSRKFLRIINLTDFANVLLPQRLISQNVMIVATWLYSDSPVDPQNLFAKPISQ